MTATTRIQAEASLLQVTNARRTALSNYAAFTLRATLSSNQAQRDHYAGAADYWKETAARHAATAAELRATLARLD